MNPFNKDCVIYITRKIIEIKEIRFELIQLHFMIESVQVPNKWTHAILISKIVVKIKFNQFAYQIALILPGPYGSKIRHKINPYSAYRYRGGCHCSFKELLMIVLPV